MIFPSDWEDEQNEQGDDPIDPSTLEIEELGFMGLMARIDERMLQEDSFLSPEYASELLCEKKEVVCLEQELSEQDTFYLTALVLCQNRMDEIYKEFKKLQYMDEVDETSPILPREEDYLIRTEVLENMIEVCERALFESVTRVYREFTGTFFIVYPRVLFWTPEDPPEGESDIVYYGAGFLSRFDDKK